MEEKLKHLELIQNIITRMANNSFLLKGWSITIIVALIGINKDGLDGKVIFIGFLVTLLFWILDAYYLAQEKIFRVLYDEVRMKSNDKIDFSMKIETKENNTMNWFVVFCSVPLSILYIGLIISFGLIAYFL